MNEAETNAAYVRELEAARLASESALQAEVARIVLRYDAQIAKFYA